MWRNLAYPVRYNMKKGGRDRHESTTYFTEERINSAQKGARAVQTPRGQMALQRVTGPSAGAQVRHADRVGALRARCRVPAPCAADSARCRPRWRRRAPLFWAESGSHVRGPCTLAGRNSDSGPGVHSDIPVPEGCYAVPQSLARRFGRLDSRRIWWWSLNTCCAPGQLAILDHASRLYTLVSNGLCRTHSLKLACTSGLWTVGAWARALPNPGSCAIIMLICPHAHLQYSS